MFSSFRVFAVPLLLQALTSRINEVADRLFAPFSKRVGVASVREWEEQHAAFEQQVAEKRATLQQQARGGGEQEGGREAK